MTLLSLSATAKALHKLTASNISLTLGERSLNAVNGVMKLELKVMKYNLLNQGPRVKCSDVRANVEAIAQESAINELKYLGINVIDVSKQFDTASIWSHDLSDAFKFRFLERQNPNKEYITLVDKFFQFAGYAATRDQKNYIVKVLLDVMRIHDPSTALHMEETAKWSEKIAKEMGLSDNEIWQIRIASILHDIGKLGVKKSVLNKLGELSDDDLFRLHDLHVVLGVDILRHIRWISAEIINIVQHHHYLDGYPEGVDFANVPIGSKIIAIADSYDAGTGGRVYATKKSPAQLLYELQYRTDKKYLRICVDAFEIVLKREGLI